MLGVNFFIASVPDVRSQKFEKPKEKGKKVENIVRKKKIKDKYWPSNAFTNYLTFLLFDLKHRTIALFSTEQFEYCN